jgi:hypothetical protein
MSDKTYELEQRADRIADAIAKLSSQIQQIESEGEVAPAGCCVLRYQARGKRGTYWYYKLHAQAAIFPTQSGEMSKYKHLGKAGSAAHIEAVLQASPENSNRGITANAGGFNSMLVGVIRQCRGSGAANVEEVVVGRVRDNLTRTNSPLSP